MSYSERIKFLKSKLSMRQSEFATFLGVSRSALSEFETGTREPSKDFILALGKKGISTDWFLSGEGDPFRIINYPFGAKSLHQKDNLLSSPSLSESTANSMIEPTPGDEGPPDTRTKELDMVAVQERTETVVDELRGLARKEIPVVVDGGAEHGLLIPVIAQGLSAGLGFEYDEGEIARYIKIPAWMARQSKDLVALPIYGDSMDPTISSGDLVVCDSGGFCGDGVYMLRDDDRGLMFCKRVVWAPGGWIIKSDNPSYEQMKIDDRSIQVVARIVATIKGMK